MRHTALVLMAIVVVLTGCGFQMRGDWQLPPAARASVMSGGVQPLYTYLQREFRAADADLQRPGSLSNAATLSILQETNDKRVLSVDNRGKVIEYELAYILMFNLVAPGGEILVPNQQIVMVRDYPFGATDVLGSSQEELLLRDDMYKDMARQIMRRIQVQAK